MGAEEAVATGAHALARAMARHVNPVKRRRYLTTFIVLTPFANKNPLVA